MRKLLITISILFMCGSAWADTASYYTRASCIAESGQCTMANGKELMDNEMVAASWFYRLGTFLVVTNIDNGRSVKVQVTDRGPAKRLVKKGRIIDLSYAAMSKLGGISKGIINVKVERAK